MKRLVVLVILLAALGGVGWAVGAMLTQTAATRWLDARAADGWVANASDISVVGFPLAFSTRFTDLDLADPETGLAISTPALELEQQVLRLDRIAAALPGDILAASPEERLTVTHQGLSAALDVQPANRFALDALEGLMRAVSVTSTAGWDMALEEADLSVIRVEAEDPRYDIVFQAARMRPPAPLRDLLDPGGLLPERIAEAGADMQLVFDAPWDMDAIEVARPQIVMIDIDEIDAAWGDMLFRASGQLTVTPGGIPEGDLTVRAENWPAMLDLAVNAGLVPERFHPTAEAMLGALAGITGQPENIDATLNFSNGRIFLGPLPLGPAPNLRLR